MTAAPIWAEFMKKAAALPQYSDMREFQQPSGVVDVELDKVDQPPGDPDLSGRLHSAFVAGTEPRETCDEQGGLKGFFSTFVRRRRQADATASQTVRRSEWAGSSKNAGP